MATTKTSHSSEAKASARAPAMSAEERAGLSDKALAKAVLDRRLRPRVSEMRRLAEAALAGGKKDKKRKSKRAADASGKASGEKAAKPKGDGARKKKKDKGRRKLATIPAPVQTP